MIKLNKKYALSGSIGFLLIGIIVILYFNNFYQPDPVQLMDLESQGELSSQSLEEDEKPIKQQVVLAPQNHPIETKKEDIEPTSVPVYICGEIEMPGVYYVASNAIVDEAVRVSGGFTAEADITAINLASPIIPNSKIIVPKKGQQIDKSIKSYENREENDVGQIVPEWESIPYDQTMAGEEALIHINEADKELLMTLPGIGEVKATAILAYRKENGRFRDKEDLKNVSGIGDKTYEQLQSLITTE